VSGEPRPKAPKPVRNKNGRARPDEPLADWCQVAVAGVCTGRAQTRHHKLRRSQGGGDEAENTVDACNPCHSHLHMNPGWAYRLGWLTRRSA